MLPDTLIPVPGLLPLIGARHAAAAVLHAASRVLAHLAHRLAVPPVAPPAALPAQLEFHANAGAPEGALYADGVLIALLPGVSRL